MMGAPATVHGSAGKARDVESVFEADTAVENVKIVSDDKGANLVTHNSDLEKHLVDFDNVIGLREELIKNVGQKKSFNPVARSEKEEVLDDESKNIKPGI